MLQEAAAESLPEHERVYRALRQRILDGELGPGEAVTIRGLAEAHAVSMTPAREAVRRLVAERALALSPSGRVSVPLRNSGAMEELFRARELLEPELAWRAAGRVTRSDIEALRRIDTEVERHLASGDAAGYVRANTAFHATIYDRADAPAMMALVQSVWLQSAPLMRRVYGLLGTAGLDDFHEAAITAAVEGDARGLSRAIAEDVRQGAALLARTPLDGGDL